MKIVIIGNSGSGKTWLAKRLGKIFSTPVVHLDDLFWEPRGFDKKRSVEEVKLLIQRSKDGASWIAEGVFGELAEHYLDTAKLLVWLDIEWHICMKRLEERGSESKKHLGRQQSKEGLLRLVEWASHYYDRQDLRSYEGHKVLLEKFSGKKVHLRDSIRGLNLFSTVRCVENVNAEVDFVIQPIQLLKIADEHSCHLDNQMLMTIGTVGLISTGCTTSYESSVLLRDPNSIREYTISYQHLEQRRNGFPGFFSKYSKNC
jgi:adenylate kinase family enzyme